jgi:nucleoside-diphosphate-sugar epimerase
MRLVHAGSQLEYGPVRGVVEEALDPRPDTAYGRSKLEATRALEAWSRLHGLACISARLFTVYGPGEHAGRLLPSLIEVAATGRPLDLTSGAQRLDFTYVEDVAEGLLRLGVAAAPAGDVVNLARGEIVAVRDFVEQAAEILGIPRGLLRFGARPDRPEEMRYSGVSNEHLRAITEWSPPTDVAGGIRRTLEWSNRSNAFA